jgi:lipocalin
MHTDGYTRGDNGDTRVQNRGFNDKTGTWKKIEGHARFLMLSLFVIILYGNLLIFY